MTQELISNPETEKVYKQRKVNIKPIFRYLKVIWGFTCMLLYGKSKVKREIKIALMATNIRKW